MIEKTVKTNNPLDGKEVLSLDVFGAALYLTVMKPDDVGLVADVWDIEKIEKWLSIPNRFVYPWYEEAVKKNIRTVFMNDTAFSSRMISDLLHDAGYYGNIYTTSVYGDSKSTGMFKQMLREENVQPEKVLHIGDDPIKDKKYPRSIGMDARCFERPQRGVRESYHRNVDDHGLFALSHMAALCQMPPATVDDDTSQIYWHNLGYTCFGPLIVAYVWWLDFVARKDGVDRLFFMNGMGSTLRTVYGTVVDDALPNDSLYDTAKATEHFPDVEKYLSAKGIFSGKPGFVAADHDGSAQLRIQEYRGARDYRPAPWYYLATGRSAVVLKQKFLPYRSYLCEMSKPIDRWLTIVMGTPIINAILDREQEKITGYKKGWPEISCADVTETHQKAVKSAFRGIMEYALDNHGSPVRPILQPEHVIHNLRRVIENPSELDRLMLPQLVYYKEDGSLWRYASMNRGKRLKRLITIALDR